VIRQITVLAGGSAASPEHQDLRLKLTVTVLLATTWMGI
jgi:hypothetical protein